MRARTAYALVFLILIVATPSFGAALELLGNLDTAGHARSVAHYGHYAFIADGPGGLVVADVGDPDSPSLLGTASTPREAHAVVVAGNYAYVGIGPTDDFGGLVVFDVTDPTAPTYVTTGSTYEGIRELALDGFILAAACGGAGLVLFDVEDPSSPVELDRYGPAGLEAISVDMQGDLVAVGTDSETLLLDISDPSSIQAAGSINATSSTVTAVVLEGDHLIAYDGNGQLSITDVSNPAAPGLTYGHVTEVTRAIELQGDTLFTADGGVSDSVSVWRRSGPNSLQWFAKLFTLGEPQDLAEAGNVVLVADGSAGLTIVKFADTPEAGISVGSLGFAADQLLIRDGVGYAIGSELQDLRIVDVQNPMNPIVVAQTTGLSPMLCLEVFGDHLYIGTADSQIYIYDITLPTIPVFVSSNPYNVSEIRSLAAQGDRLYVSTSSYFGVFDISDPTGMVGLSAVSLPGGFGRIHMEGQYAYVWYGGLTHVYDVSSVSFSVSPNLISTLTSRVVWADGDCAITENGGLKYYQTEALSSPQYAGGFAIGLDAAAEGSLQIQVRNGALRLYPFQLCSSTSVLAGLLGEYPISAEATKILNWWGSYVYLNDGSIYKIFQTPGGATAAPTLARSRLALTETFPNPFNPTTTIRYEVGESGAAITLRVVDARGRVVRDLVREWIAGGTHEVRWDGRDTGGARVASGSYFVQLSDGEDRVTKVVSLIK